MGISTYLTVDNSISNIAHEFGYNLDILFVFCVAHRLDSAQYLFEPALDQGEGSRKDSVQDPMKRGQDN
jgi:hypothetical protein